MKMLPLILAATTVAAPAFAQFTGPGAQPLITSLKAVLENPVDDQKVILRGKIVQQLSDEKYTFASDGQEIRVEIDRDLFVGLTVSPTTQVEIVGEVEKDFMESPEIDVDILRIVQ